MKSKSRSFDEHHTLQELKHFLPAQAPLKDFIHHNTLHAFQDLPFYEAIAKASAVFGYKVTLGMDEYRAYYNSGRINKAILEQVVRTRFGAETLEIWLERLLHTPFEASIQGRIGQLRSNWKKTYRIDIDLQVHPFLFRLLCNFLDQGISIWKFPLRQHSFLEALIELERDALVSLFKSERVRALLLFGPPEIEELLQIIVGDETLFEQYLFDQQFAHQGWSGMVSSVEDQPEGLLETRKITLKELIIVELLLEIDVLDHKFGETWAPLSTRIHYPTALFDPTPLSEQDIVLSLWQDAFEWSYYDQVLAAIKTEKEASTVAKHPAFQALFCIDDRECSIRRHLENLVPECQTYGTPGFFGVEFYYQPEHGKAYTKLCPAPVTPKYLIKEAGSNTKPGKSLHFTNHTHSLLGGWLITHTIGFWSALRLASQIFRPTMNAATSASFRHMDQFSKLTIVNTNTNDRENGLQIGFTIPEMAQRVEAVLHSIGLVNDFATLVYVVGHGATSVNNTHYAGYDCGACSGRPGSVNARVFCYMANHPEVRALLKTNGLHIPDSTRFMGALHDTTRDDIAFYDVETLDKNQSAQHGQYAEAFNKALTFNAKERSRRFESIDTSMPREKIHERIRRRSVSLFEPRPELNHATNALCIVGRRGVSKDIFLDRRSFMNSYDYRIDPTGKYLANILNAVAPVCGGINLEYYFSRVDNHKLGAGTKLAHNVMGLFGVANGIDGDLRPGLPSQMIEVHDPVRLMVIVEHFPEIVLETIRKNPATYEWFRNKWIHLVALHPETNTLFLLEGERFIPYQPVTQSIEVIQNLDRLLETTQENFPVYITQ